MREQAALVRRLQMEQDRAAWLAWHMAALQRMKRLPKFDKMISRRATRRGASERQTPDQMLAAMKTLFLVNGGDPKDLKGR